MRKIQTLQQCVEEAADLYRVFEDGAPDLVPTGISAIDDVIGGLSPGSAGILGARTGIGKSSIILHAALNSRCKVGIISLEDPADLLGARAWAGSTNVDSLKIRNKTFSKVEKSTLKKNLAEPSNRDDVFVACEIGSKIEEIEESIGLLAGLGCRLIWVDYLQKIRGIMEDRRNEVGTAFTTIQRACDRSGVACMIVCQTRRISDDRPLRIYDLKESGDLENEARLILLADKEEGMKDIISVKAAKSTYGGEGTTAWFKRNFQGSLQEVDRMDLEV